MDNLFYARFSGAFTKAATTTEKESYDWIMSTDTVDRDGESIKVEGWQLDKFNSNPVILWSHDHKRPAIGKCEQAVIADGKMKFKGIQFAKRPAEHVGEWFPDTVKSLIDQGILKGGSVGFLPLDRSYPSEQQGSQAKGKERVTTLRAELLEGSVVNVGCNPDALRERGLSEYAIKSIMGETNDTAAQLVEKIEKKIMAIFEVLDVMAKNMENKEAQPLAKGRIAAILDGGTAEKAEPQKPAAKEGADGDKTIGDLLN